MNVKKVVSKGFTRVVLVDIYITFFLLIKGCGDIWVVYDRNKFSSNDAIWGTTYYLHTTIPIIRNMDHYLW